MTTQHTSPTDRTSRPLIDSLEAKISPNRSGVRVVNLDADSTHALEFILVCLSFTEHPTVAGDDIERSQ
ncbi:hypothetical protein M3J09_006838 [Ascochyta lentis]